MAISIIGLVKLELEAMAEASKIAVLYSLDMVAWNMFDDDNYHSPYHVCRLNELKTEAKAIADSNELCPIGADICRHIMSL